MKIKNILLITIVIISGLMLSACGKKEKKDLNIVCTIFPEYDWVNEVLGDTKNDCDVKLLLDSGADLHSYNPSIDDTAQILACDLFIYVGGESDEWVEDVLTNAKSNVKTLCLMDVLEDSIRQEEVKEGMEEEHEEHEEHEEETEYDEHVWLSLKNAKIIVQEIADTLSLIKPDNEGTYVKNASSYIEKLNDLDDDYADAVSKGTHKTLIFGDRFPFLYLFKDYGLDYYAAFIGCSSETEASFETIYFLTTKVNELGVSSILVIDGSSSDIANTIIENSTAKNQKILILNSIQSTQIRNNVTYLSLMKGNLETLVEAMK